MDAKATKKIHRITLPIYNLSSDGHESCTIEQILVRTPGVIEVYVSAATEMAYIIYDASQCTPDMLEAVVEQAGFGPIRFNREYF